MNLWQRFNLWLRGYVYMGHRRRPGWSGSLPFYMFRCPIHGLVENYPAGYEEKLRCPHCTEEGKE